MNTVESSKVLKALSDPTRLSVINVLLQKETFVSELIDSIQIEPTLLSHHLSILRSTGVVDAKRIGKTVQYSIVQSSRIKGKPKAIDFGVCKVEFADATKEAKPIKASLRKPLKKLIKRK